MLSRMQPKLLTHRIVSQSNGDCFKPLNFRVVCYAIVGNDIVMGYRDVRPHPLDPPLFSSFYEALLRDPRA